MPLKEYPITGTVSVSLPYCTRQFLYFMQDVQMGTRLFRDSCRDSMLAIDVSLSSVGNPTAYKTYPHSAEHKLGFSPEIPVSWRAMCGPTLSLGVEASLFSSVEGKEAYGSRPQQKRLFACVGTRSCCLLSYVCVYSMPEIFRSRSPWVALEKYEIPGKES